MRKIPIIERNRYYEETHLFDLETDETIILDPSRYLLYCDFLTRGQEFARGLLEGRGNPVALG